MNACIYHNKQCMQFYLKANTLFITAATIPCSVTTQTCTWYNDAGLCVVPPLTVSALNPLCIW